MKIKKSIVSIGKTECIVIQFNYTPPKDKDISVKQRHFIEILQRRESMITYIDDLIEKINKTSNLKESRKAVYEYLPKFNESFKSIEGISQETIDINCEGKSIIYLTKRNTRLEVDNLNTNLSKSINKFYIINSKDEEFQFTINNEIYSSKDIKMELTSIDVKNLLYNLAYEEYCMGNTCEALDILSISLKDKYLTKLVLNAFTAKERENCKEMLLTAAHNKKVKIKLGIWTTARLIDGIMTEEEILDNELCFMDLLDVFEKNGDKFIPVSSQLYRRIGKKVVDNYNVFKIDKAARIATDFGNLVFSKEKINISIRYEIPGFITINPRQARAVGFNTNIFNAKVFREQTIIKDGDINIEKFQALVSSDTLEYLKGLKVENLFTFPGKNNNEHNTYTLIELNASKIPVLNRSNVLKSDSLDYILDICYDQRVAECKQKVIKFFIQKQVKNTESKDKKYTKEQAELLESYGLDSKGVYSGVDNKVVKEVSNQYECRFFEFRIKGFSVLPKVEDILVRMSDSKRKLNIPETMMKKYIEYLRENHIESSLEQLNKLLEEQKSLIKKNTRILAQIKLAKAITGDLWKGLKLDYKGNYLYVRENKTLVIKLVRKAIQM
ncbi:hypothetical protein [Clostridium sp.]|uniref:hypothetical protein n=1 Tax=Clostridium sp. TaxID=1506 RepID=UPI00284640BE|nr:hypothetical protein [Clostridium sp.]MDR3595517.1 hypothetical protein [Clostridium sp.]